MPIIDTPAGTLEVTNAILSASEFRATQKISVSNSAPTKNFSVGDKFHVSTTDADAVNITGNLVAHTLKIGNLLVSPTFDLAAVSNVGNTTSNTLQFANATTSFVASSNVEIGGNITLTSNAQVKVGSNVLAEYTGPHGREPKEMPLKKFPEIVFDESKFDRNADRTLFTQAGYTVSQSESYDTSTNYPVAYLFDNNLTTASSAWVSKYGTFGTGTGTAGEMAATNFSSFNPGTGAINGPWVKIQFPNGIKLSHINIHRWSGSAVYALPGDVTVYGSNDGTTYSTVADPFTNLYSTLLGIDNMNLNINQTNCYKYYVLHFTSTYQSSAASSLYVAIQELKFYGYEEPAPPGDLSLDTTLKSTFNSVRSNNYVMYFDGKYFVPGDGGTSNNLVDNKSVIHHNATYDSTGKYWTLDGSTQSNVTTGSLGFEGDVPHTVSTWINASNLEANALTQQLFSIGSGYDKAFLKVDDTQIAANTWHNVTYAYQGEGGSKVTYVDGRKVEEAQVEDTFGEYPPFPMTDYETGGYRVSASSDNYNANGFYSYKAFNNVQGDEGWHSGTGDGGLLHFTADAGGSIYNTNVGGSLSGNSGEWLKLEMPHKLVVGYVTLKARGTGTASTQSPKDFKILGSNDDINWDILESFTSVPYSMTGETHAVGATKGYKYVAILVTRLQRTIVGDLVIGEIQYYGHKEGDLTRFPEPTRVLKYPHVTMTGPGQRGYVASASTVAGNHAAAFKAFDEDFDTIWEADYFGTAHYQTNTGNVDGGQVTTNNVDGSGTYVGEWLQIQFPHKIVVSSYSLRNRLSPYNYRMPEHAKLLGSNNGTNWTTVYNHDDTAGGIYSGTGETRTFSFSSTTGYIYYRLATNKLFTNTNNDIYDTPNIVSWQLYGTQEDTETPLIVGGPFAGKVANFRVYDQYLGDERIQEIYDAQKDEFGHKKSSMTFYKGRIGVGTTEPEGALTVIDEPHALERFPAREVSGNDSYVEGQGTFHISSSIRGGSNQTDSIAWQPFGNSNCTLHPPRHERISEEVDFGAWHKIESPQAISLKKAEIGLLQEWLQIGSTLQSGANNHTMGRSVASNKDGTRVAISRVFFADTLSNQGLVQVFDWNGTSWVQIGNNILGDTAQDRIGENDLELDDEGNTLIVGSKQDGIGSVGGQVDVYYLNGTTWTLKGSSFNLSGGVTEYGSGVSISADGNTIALSEKNANSNAGKVQAFTWSGSAWVQKGSDMVGAAGDEIGSTVNMTPDGNYIITSNADVSSANGKVWVYAWDGSAWQLRYSQTGTGADYLGSDTNISDDGNVIAIGEKTNDDYATDHGAVHIRRWNGSTYALDQTLYAQYGSEDAAGDYFGSGCKLSGDGTRLIAGSRYVPGTGNSQHGRLYTFEYNGSSWIRRGRSGDLSYGTQGVQGTTGSGADIGFQNTFAISRDGSVITVGAPGDDTYHSNGGSAKIFQMASNVKGIWGSNDDKNWTKITGDSKAVRVNEEVEFTNIDNPNYYKYHAIVYDNFGRVDYVKLFGVRNQGSSTLHDGTLTLTKNLDVPRIGPPLDADDTPRRDRLVVEYNTSTNPVEDGVVRDTSGRGNDGVFRGSASYDATEKAFDIVSSSDIIFSGREIGGVSGDILASVSLWFKAPTLTGGSQILFIHTSAYAARTSFVLNLQVNEIRVGHGGANYTYNAGSWYPGTWYHAVGIKRGTGAIQSDIYDLYLNGVKLALTNSTGTDTMVMGTDQSIIIGSARVGGFAEQFTGEISNVKYYPGLALTAQEVKTLYDMGRCDEGHHTTTVSRSQLRMGGENLVIEPCIKGFYEEGTWVPYIAGSTSGVCSPSGSNYGWFIRVGNLVTIGGTVAWTSYSGAISGNKQIRGLPYPARNVPNARTAMAFGVTTSTGLYNGLSGGTAFRLILDPGYDFIYIASSNETAGGYSTYSVSATHVDSSGLIYGLGGTYRI